MRKNRGARARLVRLHRRHEAMSSYTDQSVFHKRYFDSRIPKTRHPSQPQAHLVIVVCYRATPQTLCVGEASGVVLTSRAILEIAVLTPLSLPYRRSFCPPAGSRGGCFSRARRYHDRRAKRQRQPPLVLSSWISFLEDDSCVRTTVVTKSI